MADVDTDAATICTQVENQSPVEPPSPRKKKIINALPEIFASKYSETPSPQKRNSSNLLGETDDITPTAHKSNSNDVVLPPDSKRQREDLSGTQEELEDEKLELIDIRIDSNTDSLKRPVLGSERLKEPTYEIANSESSNIESTAATEGSPTYTRDKNLEISRHQRRFSEVSSNEERRLFEATRAPYTSQAVKSRLHSEFLKSSDFLNNSRRRAQLQYMDRSINYSKLLSRISTPVPSNTRTLSIEQRLATKIASLHKNTPLSRLRSNTRYSSNFADNDVFSSATPTTGNTFSRTSTTEYEKGTPVVRLSNTGNNNDEDENTPKAATAHGSSRENNPDSTADAQISSDALISFSTPLHSPYATSAMHTPRKHHSHLLDETPQYLSPRNVPKYTAHDLENHLKDLNTRINDLQHEVNDKSIEIEHLKLIDLRKQEQINALERENKENEARYKSTLETIASDLHKQYSEKHVKKVRALKAAYDTKFSSKIKEMKAKLKENNKSNDSAGDEEMKQMSAQLGELQKRILELERKGAADAEMLNSQKDLIEKQKESIANLESENKRLIDDREEVIQLASQLLETRNDQKN